MSETTDDDRALLPFELQGARLIRRDWHKGEWWWSVVDVVRILADTDAPSTYWGMMKKRLAKVEGFAEVFTKCEKLKMRGIDGKLYPTDAANTETILRIVESIPSPKAEPVKQWLAQEGARSLAEVAGTLDEGPRRILIRGEVAAKNSSLNDAAAGMGVLTQRDFAVFHDKGYQGLYGGETEDDIHERKGLKPKESVLDWMGSEELAANLFRITQTEAKLRRDTEAGITGKEAANTTHYAVGRKVRETIAELGGTMPEDLPKPEKSIRELQRDEQKRLEAERQPSLFDDEGGV